ncbi:WD40-repeat-containing domain protein [Mycena galopus ATCC 62051]|nr:WD40-repeat-containing domain protein [Mycena galopus ATCC 62051]
MAGTGKSAIARSFCHMLQETKQLGGSFFCLRGDANRSNPKCIIPTLAAHLAALDGAYKGALLAVIEGISSNVNLKIQVEHLLEQPLWSALGNRLPSLVLVIDALDELNDEITTKDLVHRLVSVVPGLAIKLFVTSRPERHIRPYFNAEAGRSRQCVLRLHNIEQNLVKDDISLYFNNRLNSIRVENSLPSAWASSADIEVLADRAGKLFIYAFTAVEYIRERPRDRLQNLISIALDTTGPLTKPLDSIYGHILSESMNPDTHESGEIALTKQILAAVLTVRTPLSVDTLGGVLKEPAWRVREMLDRFHAVIYIPEGNNEGVIATFHASFGDFLTTPGRAPDNLLMDISVAHANLFLSCIQVMHSDLHFNVSKCSTSYLSNSSHQLTIPPLLRYVCLHWPHHLAAISVTETSDAGSHLACLQDVFFPRFLFWVEVLSALKEAGSASTLIMTVLMAKCLAHSPQYVTEFLADANEFVVSSLDAIASSVAHIYLSALPCIRPTSQIAKMFWPKFDCATQVHLVGIQRRQHARLILGGHNAGVKCVSFSRDGAYIVSGSDDKTICMWDAKTGDPLMEPIQGHTKSVYSVASSPDGRHIASGSADGTIQVWDAKTGKAVIEPIRGHTHAIHSVAFSPDGTCLASASKDKMICVWDANTGKAVIEPIQGHTDCIYSVAFSPDGTCIASGSDDHTIRVWDAKTGKAVIERIQGNCIRSVVFSPDGTCIASHSTDGIIEVWDAKTGKAVIEPIYGISEGKSSIAFSPDGTCLASADNDTVFVWDAKTGKAVIEPIHGHTAWINAVAFSPDGTCLASASNDSTVRVWDIKTDKAAAITTIKGHTGWIRCVAFSPDGSHIASGSSDHTIHVWDAKTGKVVMKPIQGHTSGIRGIYSVAFSPDGTRIASGSSDYTIRVWDAKTGKGVMKPIQGHTAHIHSVAFSSDGTRIASGSEDWTIRVWDAKTGKPVIKAIEGHTKCINSVAFSSDGTFIASGSDDKTIRIWDAKTGNVVMKPIQDHTDWIRCVAFSPDGSLIASGSADNTIRVWDTKTGKPVMQPIEDHTGSVYSVAFSPDGTCLASGSTDQTIRVWDVKTGKAVREPIHGHMDFVNSVAFSPDGTCLASGSSDETIRVWELRTCGATVKESGSLPVDLRSVSMRFPHCGDNWIRGPNKELVMWVPPEYQKFLQIPPHSIVGASAKVTIDFSRVVHGTDWAKCYVG